MKGQHLIQDTIDYAGNSMCSTSWINSAIERHNFEQEVLPVFECFIQKGIAFSEHLKMRSLYHAISAFFRRKIN